MQKALKALILYKNNIQQEIVILDDKKSKITALILYKNNIQLIINHTWILVSVSISVNPL